MTLPYRIRAAFANMSRQSKQALAIAADAILLLVSFHLALWLRFDLFSIDPQYHGLSVVALAGGIVALAALGVYQYILRYMNEKIVLSIVGGVIVSIMLVTAVNTFLLPSFGISRSVLAMYGLISIALLLGMRILARRLLFPSTVHDVPDSRIPVLIYGAGGAGSQLAAALRAGPHYAPVALLDDDPQKRRLMIAGLRIYSPSKLPKLVERYNVSQLLLAIPSASPARIREIIEFAEPYRLRIRLVPSLRELVDQRNRLRLRDLRVEDLLGRNPVDPIPELMDRCVRGRCVMVTGAGGSIGSELCRQILDLRPVRLVLFENSEPALYAIHQELNSLNEDGMVEIQAVLGSVRDAEHCEGTLRRAAVQTVYHAAAYKHVPIVEENIAEGLRTNTFGTLTMATAAMTCGVSDFVLISTDKAVRPTNVMGASKRLAELVLQAHAQIQQKTRFSMVRFGNVLASSGSVVPLFTRQILSGGPITLTHPEITRFFMTIPEAAQLVLQAGSMGDSGSVFVLDMGEPVKIVELARRMIKMYGLTERTAENPDGDIEIRVTGLRPGEKLYEELLIGGDVTPTPHPRILSARESSLSHEELMAQLASMRAALSDDRIDTALQILQVLVTEYRPWAATLNGASVTPQICA
ncbi:MULTISPECIES: polysaccharide biosynthesis protein [Bordetella]|uniref:Polysaccharide biosynthesis protein n=1 Tax=Bordetella genomosp. 6 TaxID=463024 RepID=A0ABX4F845_9BORD|nr:MULTISPECIES: nucleoside-diphosphate sugar epimerase/dehydratase [Bordetella]AOB24889.1 capsular biosynthesis protein [Bordetella bronchiseptica]AZW42123.1 polysaccharide biosynthesis protein [Bordetella bronchiseptica]OZI70443.1 polysaccharide biosynthesis protein [Bordetella genomosp. 6]